MKTHDLFPLHEKPAGAMVMSSPKRAAPPGVPFFENQPEFIKPEVVAELLGVSIKTIYDWNYRQKLRGVPPGLFLKFNRLLYLRTEVLRQWIRSQNPSLE
jgi:hypothetical protein